MQKAMEHVCKIRIEVLQNQIIRRSNRRLIRRRRRFDVTRHETVMIIAIDLIVVGVAEELVVEERRRRRWLKMIPIGGGGGDQLHEALGVGVLAGELLDERSELGGAGFHLHRTRNVDDFEIGGRFLASSDLRLFSADDIHRNRTNFPFCFVYF